MSSSALDTVNAFMKAAASRDYETAMTYLADDIEYQNMPLPPVTGKEAVQATLDMLLANGTGSEWVVHRELVSENGAGATVMNERTDRFIVGEKTMELPVAGVFELRDGVIVLWRDYFDLETIMKQMSG